MRIPGSSDDQIGCSIPINRLPVRLKDMRNRADFKSPAAHVPEDTNHREPIVIVTPWVLTLEAFSERILTGPVSSRHALIYDRDQRRVRTVLGCKIAASQERGPHGSKIFATNGRPTQWRPLIFRFAGSTLNGPETEVTCSSQFK